MSNSDDRCARCGVKLIAARKLTKDYRPLCDYCPLGMDPSQYVHVGSEATDEQ